MVMCQNIIANVPLLYRQLNIFIYQLFLGTDNDKFEKLYSFKHNLTLFLPLLDIQHTCHTSRIVLDSPGF